MRERGGLDDFELRLGLDDSARGAERDGAERDGAEREGAESRLLERLRLGADCRPGEDAAPRDDDEDERLLRAGAEERPEDSLERTVRPRGTEVEDRELSFRELRALPERSDERSDERWDERSEERSTPRDRLVADSRELELLPRSDSLTRPARPADERPESEERVRELARSDDLARSGALPVTLRLLSRDSLAARCVLRVCARLLSRSRDCTRAD